MFKSSRFNNFDTFQPVEYMDPNVRAQQNSFNGRIFIPPQSDSFVVDDKMGVNNVLSDDYKYRNRSGLIQMEKNETTKPYDLYSDSTKKQDTSIKLISNIIVPNALSRTFFSNDNAENIQSQIINTIYKKTQKKISKQSYQELQIIMKSIYLQYGRNLPTNIENQVVVLNKYVVDECVRIIEPNITQYNKYLEDITSPIPVMPRSQNVSIKGSKYGDFSSLIPSTMNTLE